jgi:hypothetical protein
MDLKKYPGDLKLDLGKIALSTALCILYASSGQRDVYCTAIAGVLIKHTEWSEEDINNFILQIAKEANDDEYEKRGTKGSTIKKAQRKYGMPKLAEIIGCDQKSIAEIFSWIGINESVNEAARESIGDIIEYGGNRFHVEVNSVFQGKTEKKVVTIDGPTLRNRKLFYDAIISQASVWIPK